MLYQSHKLRRTRRNARDKSTLALFGMSAEDAVVFDRKSPRNAAMVLAWCQARGCACDPYADVFSLRRWNAQGYVVNAEEPGLRLCVITLARRSLTAVDADPRAEEYFSSLPAEDPERKRFESKSGSMRAVKIPVWCRHQVRRRGPNDGYTASTFRPAV